VCHEDNPDGRGDGAGGGGGNCGDAGEESVYMSE
jgi:hypothetical protein